MDFINIHIEEIENEMDSLCVLTCCGRGSTECCGEPDWYCYDEHRYDTLSEMKEDLMNIDESDILIRREI